MNEYVDEQIKQLLDIEPIGALYSLFRGAERPVTGMECLFLVTIIARLVENEEMKELQSRYDELLKTLPAPTDSDEMFSQFIDDAVVVTVDVFDMALQLHKNNSLIFWRPGKGAVLVNGN